MKFFVGFLLDKKVGVNQPKRIEKAKILIANTPMDTDKIKVFGSSCVGKSTLIGSMKCSYLNSFFRRTRLGTKSTAIKYKARTVFR